MNWNIQLCELNYDQHEHDAVNRVLQSEWLTMGAEVEKFEEEFTKFINHENRGIFVSSATAGLHLILMSLDIKSGDEVILPGLTFVSDANVVLQLGAKPVFADSLSIDNLNVSIDDIISKITKKTKAIIVVHFAGFPLDLEELKLVCKDKDISLIEDCAHSPGARNSDKMCGSFADFSFFSFFSNKNLAVGEGGMVFAKDIYHQQKIRMMRSHGMTAVTIDRHLGRSISYDIEWVGLNYRPDEMRAALGREQLKKLPKANEIRKCLYETYVSLLEHSEITVPFAKNSSKIVSAYHIMPVILSEMHDRSAIIAHLKEKSIQTSIHYPHFKNFKAYKDLLSFGNLPIVDAICMRELTLPLHPKMTVEQVREVTDALKEII